MLYMVIGSEQKPLSAKIPLIYNVTFPYKLHRHVLPYILYHFDHMRITQGHELNLCAFRHASRTPMNIHQMRFEMALKHIFSP